MIKLISISSTKKPHTAASVQKMLDLTELMALVADAETVEEVEGELNTARIYTNKQKNLKFLLQ